MAIKIFCSNKYWSFSELERMSIYFIGFIAFKDSLILKSDDLLRQFVSKPSVKQVINFLENEFLPYCNGNFAFIIKLGNEVVAVTDYTRNYPIYFRKEKNIMLFSDTLPQEFIEGFTINELNCEEFILSGLVIGNETVYDQINSLQPAQILLFSQETYKISSYFTLRTDPLRKVVPIGKELIYSRMDELFLKIFKRMIQSCPTVRKWVVPLSGGHDSRLIINYLHRLGCTNVVCFTYGNLDSEEVAISKQAAESLGFDWHFVNYTSQEWTNLHRTNLFDEFINLSFNGCNLPHSQDFLALKILKDKKILMEGDVVIPGHTAFTESESISIMNIDKKSDAIEYVFSKYYTLFNAKNKNIFKHKLEALFENNNQTAKSFPDFFNWHERQVKFIGNSVRAYEFFGFAWRMPLWEKEVIDFWQSLNYEDRIDRKILFEASKHKLFVEALKKVPIVNKFNKVYKERSIIYKIIPLQIKSIIALIIHWESKVAEGTNKTFIGKGKTIQEIVGPTNIYPKSLIMYLRPFLIRKPFQMNVNALMAIYTLKKEVFKKKCSN